MSKLKPAVGPHDHQLGNKNAPIVLVEYGDFECPHCGHAHPLISRLVQEKGDSFNFVFRNFPLREAHPHAFVSAIAAEAAGKQGKFWQMHDLIFENQQKLSTDFLMSLAEDLGLDLAQFEEDSQRDAIKNKIEMDFESGVRSGVNGTPTFFLNGSPLFTYDGSYESLVEAIELESEMKER